MLSRTTEPVESSSDGMSSVCGADGLIVFVVSHAVVCPRRMQGGAQDLAPAATSFIRAGGCRPRNYAPFSRLVRWLCLPGESHWHLVHFCVYLVASPPRIAVAGQGPAQDRACDP